MPSREQLIEAVVRRDRLVTLAGLAVVTALAWLYLLRLGREMTEMADMGMAAVAPWTVVDAVLAAVMWTVMMIAMMLPSAAPMILVFTALDRKARATGGVAHVHTGLFVLGYLAVWSAFSVGAALAQWGLQAAALLSEDAMSALPVAGGVVLLAAGVYQLTPLKYACLARCRTPFGFLVAEWRAGAVGALVMGLRHGVFCLGCCWLLMGLLFVGGVMNLAWVAAIAVLVLAEKIVPAGRLTTWATGGLLLAWGLFTLVART
jgi:predicted metal-binding membrane protein